MMLNERGGEGRGMNGGDSGREEKWLSRFAYFGGDVI